MEMSMLGAVDAGLLIQYGFVLLMLVAMEGILPKGAVLWPHRGSGIALWRLVLYFLPCQRMASASVGRSVSHLYGREEFARIQ